MVVVLGKGVQVAFSQPFVLWGLLKGGTSIIWCWSSGGCVSTGSSLRGGVKESAYRVGGAWHVVGS